MTTSTNMQLNQTGEVATIIDCIQNLDLNDFSLNPSRSLVAAYELRKFSKPALMIACENVKRVFPFAIFFFVLLSLVEPREYKLFIISW